MGDNVNDGLVSSLFVVGDFVVLVAAEVGGGGGG